MTEFSENDTNIRELIISIWEGKWLIIGVSALFISICLLYLFFTPKIFTATVVINPMPNADFVNYNEINSVEISSNLLNNEEVEFSDDAKDIVENVFEVTRSDFLDLFIEQLRLRKLFKDEITSLKFYDMSDFENELEFQNKIIETAYSVEINPIESVEQTVNDNFIPSFYVSIEYFDKDKVASFYQRVFERANENTRKIIINLFNSRILEIEQKKNFSLIRLTLQ